MSKVERFLELQSKVTSSGLSKRETEELTRLGKVVTQEDVTALHENAWQLRLTRVYQKARNKDGRILKQCESNERVLEEYAGLPLDLLVEAVEKHAGRFSWVDAPASRTDKKAEERDRAEFTAFVRQNRYSENVANFNLAREILGPGNVTEYALLQAVQSNAVRLAPSTAEELQEREAERVDQEQLRLRNADTRTLRQEIREGYADRVKAAQAAEAQRVLDAKVGAETGAGFPLLPDVWQGKKIDKQFFLKCSRDTMRFFLQKFGDAQCTARIRGI